MPGAAEQLVEENALLLVGLHGLVLLVGLLAGTVLILKVRSKPVDWESGIRMLRWAPWASREVGLLILTLVGVNLLMGSSMPFLYRLSGLPADLSGGFQLIAGSVAFQWTGLALVAFILSRNRLSWRTAFGMNSALLPRSIARGAFFLLASTPILIFYTLVYRMTLQAGGLEVGLQSQVEEIAATTSPILRIYFVLLAAVLAPLVEELVFRGILLPFIAQRVSVPVAITIVSALFACVHGHLPSVVPLFILSIAFCLAYLYSRTLWVPIAMHSLFNATTVTLLYALS